MKKIISLFQRNYDGDHLVRNEVVPGAEWVLNGEGIATRKWDGKCCMVRAGLLYKRYDAKKGRTPPIGFEPAQAPDPLTGHQPGWLRVTSCSEDRWHLEAWDRTIPLTLMADGTYELCGPRVNGNPEGLDRHMLIRHGAHPFPDYPRDFEGIKTSLSHSDIEGIVWHHPDGRMVKIKTKDFGLNRKSVASPAPDEQSDGAKN